MDKSGPFKYVTKDEEYDTPFRDFDCPHYDLCLNLAAALNWENFSCKNCNQEVNQKLYWQAHHAQKTDTVADALCEIPDLSLLKK